MSLTVKVLGRARVLQSGFSTTGVPSNIKEFVWGELTGAYVQTTGVVFVPTDVGLTGTFDYIMLNAVSVNGGTSPITDSFIGTVYDEESTAFRITTQASSGNITEGTTGAYIINFFACGDSAAAPELT